MRLILLATMKSFMKSANLVMVNLEAFTNVSTDSMVAHMPSRSPRHQWLGVHMSKFMSAYCDILLHPTFWKVIIFRTTQSNFGCLCCSSSSFRRIVKGWLDPSV